MAESTFRVLKAGPLVTFQDFGRPGYLRFGVPTSGPMDRVSFSATNLALGNDQSNSAIEVSMGGIELECESGEVSVAVSGGGFVASIDGTDIGSGHVFHLRTGQRLSIRSGKFGRWCYLSFAGELDIPNWLGKTATHSQSGFGGGKVQSGQVFAVKNAQVRRDREGEIPPFEFRAFDGYARVVLGPQDRHFKDSALELFMQSEFEFSTSFDRMGYRLNGPNLEIRDSLSIPSEPISKGSIQVAGSGVATLLLADHQTTGGYPKIATVISADFDVVAQSRPLQKIRFKQVDPLDAAKIARVQAIELKHYFDTIS